MNDYISRGDAIAVVQYNPNPVEGIKELPAADLVEVVRKPVKGYEGYYEDNKSLLNNQEAGE